ncbi:MAG: HEAT repeat domain-containing protein [Planctomycetes bacterium]|nr:HEAT repeat domain-containing protein [Planctomycetota bacterium]
MAGIFNCAPIRGRQSARTQARDSIGSWFFYRLGQTAVLLAIVATASQSRAVTPESPEVRKLIENGLRYLESNTETRLGGRCLIALAFLKDGASLNHPRIVEALEACKKEQTVRKYVTYAYSDALAVIFLAELNNRAHQDMLSHYAKAVFRRQKKNGSWGYDGRSDGDTSSTQYGALCYWELMRVGMPPRVESVDACVNWLLRTQDPSGAWGYWGIDPGSYKLVSQTAASPSSPSSMVTAGLGGVMIFGNILGILQPNQQTEEQNEREDLPPALRRANESKKEKMRTLFGSTVDRTRLMQSIERGQAWYDKHFKVEGNGYPCYVLYSLERYKSFEELLKGYAPSEPDWYQLGYEYLKKSQQADGNWNGAAGAPCETAFAILFLLRSTQKSIKASLGEGTLVGGRGLSADLSRMKMRGGRLVTEQKPMEVDKLLDMLEGSGNESLEALMSDSTVLRVDNVGPEEAVRLQQIVKSGQPEARLLAVRTLGRMRDLDYVPTLLYAMTDPDQRVVRAARDGLRFVSRRFNGFALPDNFNDTQRYDALDKWKQWYRRVRPNAPPFP